MTCNSQATKLVQKTNKIIRNLLSVLRLDKQEPEYIVRRKITIKIEVKNRAKCS